MSNIKTPPRLVDYSSDEEQYLENDSNIKTQEILSQNNSEPMNKSLNFSSWSQDQCDMLPLPSEIQQMYLEKSSEIVIDDPEKFGGKIRSFPHERGVWATYVYIEYEVIPEFLEMVQDLRNLSEQHGIILNPVEHFHVSLSKTLKLRHHWIQPFIDSLKLYLRHFSKFKVMFPFLEVYENEEKTRTFLGLKADFGYDNLCKIIEKVDSCLTEFKLPLYYENPSFHISCASCVGNKSKEIELFMADLNGVFQTFSETFPASRTLFVKKIFCKSGNKLFTFPLK